ncbi:hypothetical protein FFI94_022300 [Rhodococcus sp. KBS0724]|uniref:hypothetical protein n=1 Tax=Rhodococcus sp. KBS0724 TaxID=1179674 RepID=UPI00110E5828|nr:hypothetical protein [Rhodococcus sp. KBS0724]TSD48597.1 hypothetical protein FFI94_022300 [Rhodococcus sp. KBS0724]
MTLRDDIANLPLVVKDKDEGHNSHHMVLHKAVQDHDARLDSAIQDDDPRLSNERTPTNSSVVTTKIADLAVTGTKVADGTINGGQKLVDSSVPSSKLATNAVATAKIADTAVTKPKLATALQASIDKADSAVQPAALTTKADLVGGLIPQAQLPAIAVTEFLGAVATQSAMLALAGQRGDWCTRTDRGTDWQLIAEPPTTLANWRERTYPASPVSSVAGRNGAVTLSVADVSGAAPTVHSHTTAQVTGLDAAIAARVARGVTAWKLYGTADSGGVVVDQLLDYSAVANAWQIAQRYDDGRLRVGAAVEGGDAVTKNQLDTKIQVVASWPASPVAGVLYLMAE